MSVIRATAVCALVALEFGGCAKTSPRSTVRYPIAASKKAASPAEIRAFLAKARRELSGAFVLRYDVTISYGHRAGRRIVVTAAQRSAGHFFYRTTPSIVLAGPDGRPAGYSFEVFYRPGTTAPSGSSTRSGPPIYTCRKELSSSRWSCVGPYAQIGMGGLNQLLGPYPPQALLLGLENAAVVYTGVPAPPAIRPEPAFLVARRASGQPLTCLEFASTRHPAGSVCLRPDGVIASYDLSESATWSVYETATLRSYLPQVRRDTFNLPATPTRAQ